MWATDREHLTSQIGKITVWLGMPRHCLRQNFYASSGTIHPFAVVRESLQNPHKTAKNCSLATAIVRPYSSTFATFSGQVGGHLEAVGQLLRAIDRFEGYPLTKLALQLTPHVFVRPGELRHAEWNEFNLDVGIWTIPAD